MLNKLSILGVISNGGTYKQKIQAIRLNKGCNYLICILVIDGQGNAYDISNGQLTITIKQDNLVDAPELIKIIGDNTNTGLATFNLSIEDTNKLSQNNLYMYDVVYTQENNIAHVIPVSPVII